jgi:hypothetical protein
MPPGARMYRLFGWSARADSVFPAIAHMG